LSSIHVKDRGLMASDLINIVEAKMA